MESIIFCMNVISVHECSVIINYNHLDVVSFANICRKCHIYV